MSHPPLPQPAKYIDPLVDFAFKKIFGSEPNKDLLIHFLNEVFSGRKIIQDLTYNKNEFPGETATEGGAIFDLLCTGHDGEQFLIEVQRGRQPYFKERALFYTSRLISSQAPKGNRARWKYELKEVYLIALMETAELPGSAPHAYLHDIALCNRHTGQVFYERLGYIYIELSKFTKAEKALITDLDRWLYVLKNLSQLQRLPVYLRKPVFEKLFHIAAYTNLSKEEKAMYDSSMKYKWDNAAVAAYEQQLAREEGRTAGRKEGLEKGVREGRQQGKLEQTLTIARTMKKEGIPTDQIARFTKLTTAQIEQL